MSDLISQLSIYEDSEELANALCDMAKDREDVTGICTDHYYLKECEIHIRGLWDLANELAKELEDKQ